MSKLSCHLLCHLALLYHEHFMFPNIFYKITHRVPYFALPLPFLASRQFPVLFYFRQPGRAGRASLKAVPCDHVTCRFLGIRKHGEQWAHCPAPAEVAEAPSFSCPSAARQPCPRYKAQLPRLARISGWRLGATLDQNRCYGTRASSPTPPQPTH